MARVRSVKQPYKRKQNTTQSVEHKSLFTVILIWLKIVDTNHARRQNAAVDASVNHQIFWSESCPVNTE